MNDQAERLRQVVNNLKTKYEMTKSANVEGPAKKTAKVLAITSGKGGVGKTSLALNLSIALSQSGLRVIIVDADFGLANIEVLLGIIPKYTLLDVLNNKKNILEILTDGPERVKFLSCGSGVEELIKLQPPQIIKLLDSISLLDKIADIILVDTGAGISENVMKILLAADEILLVITPEPTSITDAYALIKMISLRDKSKTIKVVVNRADNVSEAEDILDKIVLVAEKFLGLKVTPLGYVLKDETVVKSIKRQMPLTLYFPNSRAANDIVKVAKKIAEGSENNRKNINGGIRAFIRSLTGSFKN